jgi:hypothetical protein
VLADAESSTLALFRASPGSGLFQEAEALDKRMGGVRKRVLRAEQALAAVEDKCATSLAEFDWQEGESEGGWAVYGYGGR